MKFRKQIQTKLKFLLSDRAANDSSLSLSVLEVVEEALRRSYRCWFVVPEFRVVLDGLDSAPVDVNILVIRQGWRGQDGKS